MPDAPETAAPAEPGITPQDKAAVALAEAPPNESFADKWDRLSENIDKKAGKPVIAKPVASVAAEPDAPEDLAESDAESEPESVEEKPKGKASAESSDAKLEAFKKQAKELGFTLDEQKVTTQDAIKFRNARKQHAEQMRKDREEIENAKKLAEQEASKLRTDANVVVERAQKIVEAIENGDYDTKAQALGYKDWNDMIDASVAQQSDPHYRELREVKRKLAEREERETKAKREAEEAAAREKQEKERNEQQAKRQTQLTRERQWVSERSAESQDPVVKTFAEDPLFINAAHNILRANMDPDTGESITVEQALDLPLPGGQKVLRDVLRELGGRFAKAFPDLWQTSEDATAGAATTGKPLAPRSTALSNSRRRGGGGAEESTEDLSFAELKRRSDQQIRDALRKASEDERKSRVRY